MKFPATLFLLVATALWFGAESGRSAAQPTPPAAPGPLFADPVIARGKGVLVRRSELEDAFVAYKSNMAGRQQSIPENQRLLREAQLLDRLIVTQLLVNRSTDADRAVARDSAATFLAESKKTSPSDELFARRLKAMGLSMDQFNVRVMEQAMAEAVLERELKTQITVSEAQIQELYQTGSDLLAKTLEAELVRLRKDPSVSVDTIQKFKERIEQVKQSNLARLQEPARVRVSHIFLNLRDRQTDAEIPVERRQAKRRLIEKLLARAKAGEEFQRLIDEYSEDRSLAENRGEYTLSRDSRFAPEFKAAAFSLEPGQISDIVTSVFGYHVLKLHEKLPAKKTELKDVHNDIKRFLSEQELQKRLPDYFAGLKKDAGVEILDTKYQIELPKDLDPLPPGS